MEDENGLELSLGLSCGGSSVKPNSKNGISLDTRAEEVDRGGKMDDDFKNFLNAENHRTEPSKPEENFFYPLSKAKEEDAPANLNGGGLWFADNNKSGEIEEAKRLETGNKRKMFFDERNNQKKHEIEVHHADLHERARTPRISISEDGSKAGNGYVADSEAENSASRPFSLKDYGFKQFMRVGDSSVAPKEVCTVSDSSATDLSGQKRFIDLSEKDFKLANLNYGASFPVQQANLINMSYPSTEKESNSVGAPSPQIPAIAHAMPSATSECSGAQRASNGNLPLMFQLPISDKDNLRGSVFHPRPSFAGEDPPNSANYHAIRGTAIRTNQRRSKPACHSRKLHYAEDVKRSSTNLGKNVSDQPKEGFSIDVSAIKPGLAAVVKFGGFGSYPNLPWVYATGSNGRTISGVSHRYINNHIRIVCACHGSHMSLKVFVRHANEDTASPDGGGAVLGTVANGNPSASSHS